MKVVLLHSELSDVVSKDEEDVLVQVERVDKALRDFHYDVEVLPFSMNLAAVEAGLKQVQPQFVFNLVETVGGSGRLIHAAPSLLDHLGIRYTGAPTEAAFITSNKILAKKIMLQSGVPTPVWLDLSAFGDNPAFEQGHYIVKSLWEHASVGLDEDSVVYAENREALFREMCRRKEPLGGNCFAEAYIEGREFNISLLGGCSEEPTVLPAAEIRFEEYPADKKKVVGYRAKWETESFEYRNTRRSFEFAVRDESLLNKLETTARECWRIFGLRGYARVDFRVDHAGKLWVLEVNTNPCLSPDSGFTAATERAGLSFHSVVQRIIESSECAPELMLPATNCSASSYPFLRDPCHAIPF